MILNQQQIQELNDIYTRILKKYSTHASDAPSLPSIQNITIEQAEDRARFDATERRDKIITNYNEQAKAININASRRGLVNSSIVIAQLAKVMERRDGLLDRLEERIQKQALKLFTDAQRLSLTIARENSMQRSRSMRDFIAMSRAKFSVPFNATALIEEEVYHAYFAWLLQFGTGEAVTILRANGIFLRHMSRASRDRLEHELTFGRRGGDTV